MMRASLEAGRMRHGRQTADIITAARPRRSATVPAAPTAGNSCFASAAPSWKHTIATSRKAMGSSIEAGLKGGRLVTIIRASNVAD